MIATLPPNEQEDLIGALLESDVQSLVGDYFLDARCEQLEPPGDWWFIWMIMAGRGFGKNWAGSNWIIDRHRLHNCQNTAIVAATASDLRKYCIEGDSGVLNCASNEFRPLYQPSKTRLLWPNGSVSLLYTSEEPERLRGPNIDAAWCDEVGAWKKPEACLDMLFLTLRLGDNPLCMMTTTPRPIPAIRDLLKRESDDVIVTRGSTMDNRKNLAPVFVERVIKQFAGTRLERQEIYGELLEDFEGALWNHAMLEECRAEKAGPMVRKVIGVDPPTTVKGECGIIAAGVTGGPVLERKGYLLGDHSINGSPNTWARKVVGAYYHHGANAVIAEVNQGGDMVESTIKNVDNTIPVIKVRASQGKVARADPVALVYEQKRIKHLDVYPLLEDEMCAMVPGELKESPNRVDALVWAFWDLFDLSKNKMSAGTFGRNRDKKGRKARRKDRLLQQRTKRIA